MHKRWDYGSNSPLSLSPSPISIQTNRSIPYSHPFKLLIAPPYYHYSSDFSPLFSHSISTPPSLKPNLGNPRLELTPMVVCDGVGRL